MTLVVSSCFVFLFKPTVVFSCGIISGMAGRCGCTGICNCGIEAGTGTSVFGTGGVGDSYIVSARYSTDAGNVAGQGTDGHIFVPSVCDQIAGLATSTDVPLDLVGVDASGECVKISSLLIDVNVQTVTFNPLTGELVVTETDGQTHTVTIAASIDCETVQDCVGGMLNNVGFVYNDALNIWVTNPAATAGQILTADGLGNADWQTPVGGCPPPSTYTIVNSWGLGTPRTFSTPTFPPEEVTIVDVSPPFIMPPSWCPEGLIHIGALSIGSGTVLSSPPYDAMRAQQIIIVEINGSPWGTFGGALGTIKETQVGTDCEWSLTQEYVVAVNPGDSVVVTHALIVENVYPGYAGEPITGSEFGFVWIWS